jgi:hypothetical protein
MASGKDLGSESEPATEPEGTGQKRLWLFFATGKFRSQRESRSRGIRLTRLRQHFHRQFKQCESPGFSGTNPAPWTCATMESGHHISSRDFARILRSCRSSVRESLLSPFTI